MPLRLACLALLGTLAGSAAAQTDAEVQFGIAVGNVWEYDLYEGAPWSDTLRVVGHERWAITRELSPSGGGRRFELEGGLDGAPICRCEVVASAPFAPFPGYDFQLAVSGPCTFGDLGLEARGHEPRFYVARRGAETCTTLVDPYGD